MLMEIKRNAAVETSSGGLSQAIASLTSQWFNAENDHQSFPTLKTAVTAAVEMLEQGNGSLKFSISSLTAW